MNILIGADWVPTPENRELFAAGDIQALFGGKLCALLKEADFRIFNLEVPLTDTASPIEKSGPALIAPTASVAAYQAAGADLLTLANNHIFDQDGQGLDSTVLTLDTAGIAHLGTGDTAAEAAKPYVFSCDEKEIGVYACAEHEFSIVSECRAGANPFDPLESPDHIAALKAECDYVIVLYHGGKEYYRYPSPALQKTCRKLVDKGADLVLCQHTHAIGCEEKYNGGTIVYGQGNFLFGDSPREEWKTGLLVRIGDGFDVSYLPLVSGGGKVAPAEGEEAEAILNGFRQRSAEILAPGFIAESYRKFAGEMENGYLSALCAQKRTFFTRVCNKLTNGRWQERRLRKRYFPHARTVLRNFIECEAHRKLLLEGLKNDSKQGDGMPCGD